MKSYGIKVISTSGIKIGHKYIRVVANISPLNSENIVDPSSPLITSDDEAFSEKGEFSKFVFTMAGTSETGLILKTDKDDKDVLYDYLKISDAIKVRIVTTLIEENEINTLSSFSIDNGQVTGYFIERDGVPPDLEFEEGYLKRIPANTYDVIENHCNYPPGKRPHCGEEFRLITTPEKSGSRSGILIHMGSTYEDITGCLIPVGSNYSSFEQPFDLGNGPENFTVYSSNQTSETTLVAINSYIESKKNEAKARKKVLKIIIEINRL